MSEIGLLEPFAYKNEWTVHCDQCEHSATISVKDMAKEALVDIAECTYLQYWRREREFLEELAALVPKHSRSLHPYKRLLLGKHSQKRDHQHHRSADQAFEDDLMALLLKYRKHRPENYSLKWLTQRAHAAFAEQLDNVKRSSLKCTTCGAGNLYVNLSEFCGD